MHFSLVKSLYKNQVIWDYMTKKSPDFSQKVWLLVERNGGYKWLLVFLCLVSDHVKTSSRWWRVWGEEQGRARGRPGKRKCAEVCGLWGEAVGRELSLLMWLSCPLLLYFFRPTLACLSLTVFVLLPLSSIRSHSLSVSLCDCGGAARTSPRGQSPHDWKERKLSCLDPVRCLMPHCLHVSARQI